MYTEKREVFVVKLYYYEKQEIGVKEDEEPSHVETLTAYPFRHANKRKTETCFHRLGSLF